MTRISAAHRFRLGLLLATAAALGGCQQPQRPRPSLASSAACRSDVDRVYAAQNRVDLSTRDQRDTPFAADYLPGVTTRGLGARFGRDNLMSSCLTNAGGPDGSRSPAGSPGTGPTFSPTSPATVP